MSKKVVYKAQLGSGAPVEIVGRYEISDEEWEEELKFWITDEEWLNSQGSDWAYEAVHSDCLRYWAEFEDES